MSTTDKDFHKQISIDQVACPLHILQLKKGLKTIKKNEILKVIPGQAAVITELKPACHTLGHNVEVVTENNQELLFIEK
jgi:TusA-related sulfurtransferase